MWSMTAQMQEELWWLAGLALAVAGIAAFADRRRAKRTDLDAVGFMPWPLILVISMLSAAVMAALALKSR